MVRTQGVRWLIDTLFTRGQDRVIKDRYNPAVTARQPPRGNIRYLDPGRSEPYLLDLVELGIVDLGTEPGLPIRRCLRDHRPGHPATA